MTPIWMHLYAPITAARVAAQDATGYIIDVSGNFYHYDAINNVWVQNNTPSSSPLASIAASHDGSVVGVCSSGNVYLLNSGSWSQMFVSAYPVVNAAVGDVNNLVSVDTTNAVVRTATTFNTNLSSGPMRLTATSGLGQIWGVGSTGNVLRFNASTGAWNTISGKNLVQVHVSQATNNDIQVVGVDSLGKGWTYNASTSAWTSIPVPNPGDKFAWIEAGAGYIWCLLANGDVYRGFI